MGKARNFAKLINAEGKLDISALAPSAGNASIGLSAWVIQEISGVLYFTYNGVKKAKLDSSGNITVLSNVTGYGTVT